MFAQFGLLLADDTQRDRWPHCVHWIEHMSIWNSDFADLLFKFRPPTEAERVPYEESPLARNTSPEEYRQIMAEIDAEARTVARGMTAAFGLASPPEFGPEPPSAGRGCRRGAVPSRPSRRSVGTDWTGATPVWSSG
jgi:hypothetical protein